MSLIWRPSLYFWVGPVLIYTVCIMLTTATETPFPGSLHFLIFSIGTFFSSESEEGSISIQATSTHSPRPFHRLLTSYITVYIILHSYRLGNENEVVISVAECRMKDAEQDWVEVGMYIKEECRYLKFKGHTQTQPSSFRWCETT
jgi:hypothetical protein